MVDDSGASKAPRLALKGQLRPRTRWASVERIALDARFTEVARQVWVPRWSVPAGTTVSQPVLQYPGANVVVEPDGAAIHLPITGVGVRELTGTSWAAGLLLRPGAGALVVPGDHGDLLGAQAPIPDGDELTAGLRELMPDGTAAEVRHAFERWLEPLLGQVDEDVTLVNAIADAAENDGRVTTVRDLVERFGLSERTLQRLVRRRIGFSPRWLIQRRRLQEAAFRLRSEPDLPLVDLAVEVGYADQAHFTRDFGAVVGHTPADYRRLALSDSSG